MANIEFAIQYLNLDLLFFVFPRRSFDSRFLHILGLVRQRRGSPPMREGLVLILGDMSQSSLTVKTGFFFNSYELPFLSTTMAESRLSGTKPSRASEYHIFLLNSLRLT